MKILYSCVFGFFFMLLDCTFFIDKYRLIFLSLFERCLVLEIIIKELDVPTRRSSCLTNVIKGLDEVRLLFGSISIERKRRKR